MAILKGSVQGIMQSLNKCRSTDESRYFMTECYLDRDEGDKILIIATDGRTLAVWEPDAWTIDNMHLASLPTGYVLLDDKRLLVTALVKEGQYPTWRKVDPDLSTMEKCDALLEPNKEHSAGDRAAQFALVTGTLIKSKYIERIAWASKGETYIAAIDPEKHAIVYRHSPDKDGHSDYRMVIMPYTESDESKELRAARELAGKVRYR
jgi:hypothetical protein